MSRETPARMVSHRVTEGLMMKRSDLSVVLVSRTWVAVPSFALAAREPVPEGLGLTGARGAR
jgi:hypothetical protein